MKYITLIIGLLVVGCGPTPITLEEMAIGTYHHDTTDYSGKNRKTWSFTLLENGEFTTSGGQKGKWKVSKMPKNIRMEGADDPRVIHDFFTIRLDYDVDYEMWKIYGQEPRRKGQSFMAGSFNRIIEVGLRHWVPCSQCGDLGFDGVCKGHPYQKHYTNSVGEYTCYITRRVSGPMSWSRPLKKPVQ